MASVIIVVLPVRHLLVSFRGGDLNYGLICGVTGGIEESEVLECNFSVLDLSACSFF